MTSSLMNPRFVPSSKDAEALPQGTSEMLQNALVAMLMRAVSVPAWIHWKDDLAGRLPFIT